MINTANDFQAALTYLETETDSYPDPPGDNMSAYDFNKAMQAVETHLNALYEKIRTLEDVNAYCRTYLINKIQEQEEAFKKKLTVIQDTADQYRDKSYVAYTVPIQENTEVIHDRDGSVIQHMDIVDGCLEQHAIKSDKIPMASISRSSDAICYQNTYQNMLDGHSGRSYYVSDTPLYNGVQEDISISFTKAQPCNIVNIKGSNCSINNIRLINEENSEEPLDGTNETFKEKTVKGLKFTLNCRSYEYIAVTEQDTNSVNAGVQLTARDTLTDVESATADANQETFLREYSQYQEQHDKTADKNIAVEEAKG